MNALKEYLGDSVYAGVETGMIQLTTDSHEPRDAKNIIFLEPQVFDALVRYVARMREQNKLP